MIYFKVKKYYAENIMNICINIYDNDKVILLQYHLIRPAKNLERIQNF